MKKNIIALDFIRVIFCIAILFYHLGILKGGFLAVSSFFVLSAYLSTKKALTSDKFSWKEYYLRIVTRIYLPLIVVVFSTVAILSLINTISYINLKPEVTSVLFSYNNYWQLSANLDYFTKNINSPFIHLWYISILIQYQLIFPFVYLFLKKIRTKLGKKVPIIILSLLSILATIYFYVSSLGNSIMLCYYDTLTRIFSILFGILLSFMIMDCKTLIPKWINKNHIKIIFYTYLILQILLFIVIDSSSKYFPLSLIITTLITIRLIVYGLENKEEQDTFIYKVIRYISKISYEVYLIQYPVIYLFKEINLNRPLKIILIIIIVFTFSIILHYVLNWKKQKQKIPKLIFQIFTLIIVIYGFYLYIIAKDYTKEINQLKNQLNQNEASMLKKQEEYLSKLTEEEIRFETILKEFENDEKSLEGIISNLSIVGIGDSVMLNAINDLYLKFPNGYFDAQKDRTDYEVYDIVNELNRKNKLNDIIIFNLGTNGECPKKCKEEYLKIIGKRKIFWVNATNPDYPTFNEGLKKLAETYDNIHIIDWVETAKGHPEYLIADGTHLTKIGASAYSETIYKALYDYFLEEINKEKELKIKEQEQLRKERITFIGNDLILNAYNIIQNDYKEVNYLLDSNYTFSTLKDSLIKNIKENNISYKIVFAFDKKLTLSQKEYEELISICKNHKIYIVSVEKPYTFQNDKVKVIDFYSEIKNNDTYMMFDNIHLTEEGKQAFCDAIKISLKE